jgi:hypothetical protein
MEFEWDENKNRENIKKHGISFKRATKIFLGNVLEWIDNRTDLGEERIIVLSLRRISVPSEQFFMSSIPGVVMRGELFRQGGQCLCLERGKLPTIVQLDSDIAEWFKSQGYDYQARINAVLRNYVEAHQ